MTGRRGIAIGGTIIIDKINEISAYPEKGELTKIKSVSYSIGGCVPNVGLDLKKLRPTLDVLAIGKISRDSNGELVLKALRDGGLNVSGIIENADEKTSFTEVMSITNGQRTFFTYPGASANLGFGDIDFDKISSRILHLGYFLLLDKIDAGDGINILKEASLRGIKTSIDLVSENSDRYALIIPCLKYTDYLIVNEIEASKIAGMEPFDENLRAIAERLMSFGVREKVIIHKSDGAVLLSKDGFFAVPAYNVSKNEIAGTTGAGDAFCAGALLSIYDEKNDKEILEFASATALVSLFSKDATSSIACENDIKEISKKYDRKRLCW
jgi:sugar/nucleoside kinase (ribokinase family)